MNRRAKFLVHLSVAVLLVSGHASAADAVFAFKAAYRDVSVDPDGVWTGDALVSGKVSVFEYELRAGGASLIVSQIWNEDCAASTCPTRLVRFESGGRRTVLVDDMMRQVIPPNDPRFASLPKSGPQADYAQRPFRLSEDGKTLINGDFTFELDGGKQ